MLWNVKTGKFRNIDSAHQKLGGGGGGTLGCSGRMGTENSSTMLYMFEYFREQLTKSWKQEGLMFLE